MLEDADANDGVEGPVGERELLERAAREPDPQPRQPGRLVETIGVAETVAVRVAARHVEPGCREQERQKCQPRPGIEQAAVLAREVRPCVRVLPLAAEMAERVGRDREVGPPDAPRRGEEVDLEPLQSGGDLRVARVFEVREQRVAVAGEQAVRARRGLERRLSDRLPAPLRNARRARRRSGAGRTARGRAFDRQRPSSAQRADCGAAQLRVRRAPPRRRDRSCSP
jgi:hypothetical protein